MGTAFSIVDWNCPIGLLQDDSLQAVVIIGRWRRSVPRTFRPTFRVRDLIRTHWPSMALPETLGSVGSVTLVSSDGSGFARRRTKLKALAQFTLQRLRSCRQVGRAGTKFPNE
jgi:hypothetical protein